MDNSAVAAVQKRLPGLDGLRGIAALIVLLSHMSNNHFYLVPGADFQGIGKSGVYLFFVLSAYLLSSQFWAWQPDYFREKARWVNYFQGRIFRIWPLFLVVIVTSLLTTIYAKPLLHGDGLPVAMSFKNFIRTLLLKRGDEILWTIAVEFKFYFWLPVIMAVLIFLLKKRVFTCVALLLILISCSFIFKMPGSEVSPLRFIGVFLSGILVAIVSHVLSRRTHSPRPAALFEIMAWLCLVAYLGTIPAFFVHYTSLPATSNYFKHSIPLFSIIWSFLVIGMMYGTGLMRRILALPALAAIGTISYSLYLWHFALIKLMSLFVTEPNYVHSWLLFFSALAFATLSYLVIERPILQWSNRRRRAALNRENIPATPELQPAL